MRHGPTFWGTCEACGASHACVQFYTDGILKDPIALCIDANSQACMDRQQSPETKYERGLGFPEVGE